MAFRYYKRGVFISLSKEKRDELIEFQKRSQCNNDNVKSRNKVRFKGSNKDNVNVSSLIQSEIDNRANKEKVDTTKLNMETMLDLIDKEKSNKLLLHQLLRLEFFKETPKPSIQICTMLL